MLSVESGIFYRSANDMERTPKSDSYRKAVQTAQNIIKSRTGNVIMKQAYKTVDRLVEKKAKLIDHRKGKELRKLAHDKVQFIHEQDEKLKRKDAFKTHKKSNDGRRTVVEIHIPSEKDFAEEENCDENLAAAKSPRTVKSSPRREKCKGVHSTKEKEHQSEKIFPTQIEEYELQYTENGEIVLPVKTIREFNEEAKRGRLPLNDIEVQTTNFYQDYDEIVNWVSAVEKENLGHFQRTPRSNRKKNNQAEDGEAQAIKHKEKAGLNNSKSAKESLNNDKGLLKLPKLDSNTGSPAISRRTKSVKRMESLDDPRFTNLLESLTPVSSTTLKLPKIPRSAENKSRAS